MVDRRRVYKDLERQARMYARAAFRLAVSLGDIANAIPRAQLVADEFMRCAARSHTGGTDGLPASGNPAERLLRKLVREMFAALQAQARSATGVRKEIQTVGWALDEMAEGLKKLRLTDPPADRGGRLDQYVAVLETLAVFGAKLEIDRRADGVWIRVDDGEWFRLRPREWALLAVLIGPGRSGADGERRFWSLEALAKAFRLREGHRGLQNVRNRVCALRKRLLEHRVNPFYLESNGRGVRFLLRPGCPPVDHTRRRVRLAVARRARS